MDGITILLFGFLLLLLIFFLVFFAWFCFSSTAYLKSIATLLEEQNNIITELKSKEKSTKKDEK